MCSMFATTARKQTSSRNDTAAFQQALVAQKAGGGIVYALRGNYLFEGFECSARRDSERGVESVPAHNGIRDAGLPKPTDDGTTLLVTKAPARGRAAIHHAESQQHVKGW